MKMATNHRLRILGAVIQGFVMGLLVFAAIMGLIDVSSSDQLFRYQGF